jgi:ATP-dependent Clp protease ATP-binding subunit ClpC
MTSNIGARDLKDFGTGVGFATKAKSDSSDEMSKNVISKALKRTFSPEFLNRIDDIIIFNSLEKDDIFRIIDIAMGDLIKRVKILGYDLRLTEKAKSFLADKGYDPAYGARPLHRAIQKYVEDPLAEELLRANAKAGESFELDLDEENQKLYIKPRTSKKKKSAETE